MDRLITSLEVKEKLGFCYPDKTTDSETLQQWGSLYGVKIDASGLIIPPKNRLYAGKIAESFPSLIEIVNQQRRNGKHILWLPGSYDLAHAGHLSYVVQATEFYQELLFGRLGKGVGRGDLFVVAPMDDDLLIEQVKKEVYRKVTGKDGPIEKGFTQTGTHPRLEAIASLPVDLVGFLPSPKSDKLPEPANLNTEELNQRFSRSDLWLKNEKFAANVQSAIVNYQNLINRIRNGEKVGFDDYWSIELWQLYLHSSLNKRQLEGENFQCGITRIVSSDEVKYFDIVQSLMEMSKIETIAIQDRYCMSSKDIVEKYGVEELMKRKKDHNGF